MMAKKQTVQQQQQQPQPRQMKNSAGSNKDAESMIRDAKDEEMARSALAAFKLKEEEIEKKKMEVRDKVQAQLGRVGEATRRLSGICRELEALTDPMRKEVALVRKKIDTVNRELKPLSQSCQKKEREYKESLEALNEKNKEKAQLITKLMELISESERLRIKKLEELSKSIDVSHQYQQ